MVIRKYPDEIEKMFKICEPYLDRVEDGELNRSIRKNKKVGMGTRPINTISREVDGIFIPNFREE